MIIIHPVLQIIQDHIVRNMTEYITLVGALIIAGICTMPQKIPTTIQECWDWGRNTLQSATPITRAATVQAAASHIITNTPNAVTETIKNESTKETT
jgi:hypothetical protein